MRNLGRRDPGPYPLLPECQECHHYMSANRNYAGPNHWPWCSQATEEQRRIYEESRRGEGLRALRTAKRVGE